MLDRKCLYYFPFVLLEPDFYITRSVDFREDQEKVELAALMTFEVTGLLLSLFIYQVKKTDTLYSIKVCCMHGYLAYPGESAFHSRIRNAQIQAPINEYPNEVNAVESNFLTHVKSEEFCCKKEGKQNFPVNS